MTVDCFEIEKWAGENPNEVNALTERFEQLDSTLTTDEIARTYVAQAYIGEDYFDMDFSRMLLGTLEQTGDFEALLKLAWDLACRSPFNLDALNALLSIVPQEHDIWKVAAWRFSQLLKAIMSTGDGSSLESAICVICAHDEYMLMRGALELTDIADDSPQLIIRDIRSYHCYTVTPSDQYPHDKVYFEITPYNIEAE